MFNEFKDLFLLVKPFGNILDTLLLLLLSRWCLDVCFQNDCASELSMCLKRSHNLCLNNSAFFILDHNEQKNTITAFKFVRLLFNSSAHQTSYT